MGNEGCKPDPWGPWGDCPLDCWDGSTTAEQVRKREKVCPEGKPEEKEKEEKRDCPVNQTKITCPTECQPVSEWTEWTECSKTCDGGTQSRTRKVEDGLNGGTPCTDRDRNEERKCNVEECPRDCVLGNPSKWTECSVTCGKGGKRTQGRAMVVEPTKDGKPCRDVEPENDKWTCEMSEQVDGICLERSDDCPDNPPCKEYGQPVPGAEGVGAVPNAATAGAGTAAGMPGEAALPGGQASAALHLEVPWLLMLVLFLLLRKLFR